MRKEERGWNRLFCGRRASSERWGRSAARQKGYSTEQQVGLGLAIAATEYFTEKLFGGNPAYDSDVGLVNRLVDRLTKNKAWNGTLMSVLASTPMERLNEGLGEITSDILQPLAEYAVTGNWSGYDLDQMIEDGVVGVITALVAGAGEKAVNRVALAPRVSEAGTVAPHGGEFDPGAKRGRGGAKKRL